MQHVTHCAINDVLSTNFRQVLPCGFMCNMTKKEA